MPRFQTITANREKAALREELAQPALLRVHTSFAVHERNDVPGRVCPCCGSENAKLVGREDDLEVLVVPRKQMRRNSWDVLTPDGRAMFRQHADSAEPWGSEGATVWDVPIVYTCGVDQVEQIRDDDTMVMLWSGGWRSMKSHTCAQWWSRGWVRYGAQGELFWLMGPLEVTAFRLMERIFYGRGRAEDGGTKRSPSVLPSYQDEETGLPMSMLAHGLPDKVGRRDPSFTMCDGSRVELRHAQRDAALEGDDVRRIMVDELVRLRTKSSYRICLGRVTQCNGQIGAATVPDQEGEWVYDEIVAPFEQGVGKGRRVFTLPTTGNLWLGEEQAQRLKDQCDDSVMLDEKFYGKWARAGLYAYASEFKPDIHVLDIIGHEAGDWGFEHDVTKQAARGLFKGKPADYLGVRDFNFRPQTGLVVRVFASDPRDRSTWTLAFLDEHLESGDARRAAKSFSEHFRAGKYAGAGLVCDCNGFYDGHRYGGRPSKTTDAWEFEAKGFMVRPPLFTPKKASARGRSTGGEARNPGLSDSKKLVRRLLEQNRILVDSVCIKLIRALPRVPRGEKRASQANTAADRQIFNFDDCVRYICWALFADEIASKPKRKSSVRGMARV